MTEMTPQVGDVVKYGKHSWQWGRVVQLDTDEWVWVRRRNRVWVRPEDIEVVIPAGAFPLLCGDITRREPFVNHPD